MHNSMHLHHAAPSLPQACHGTVYMPAVHAYLLCMAACDKQVGQAQAPTVGGPSSGEPVQHGSDCVSRLGELTAPYYLFLFHIWPEGADTQWSALSNMAASFHSTQ